MHLQDPYRGGGPLVMDRWNERRSSSRDDDNDPATTPKHSRIIESTTIKMPIRPLPSKKSSLRGSPSAPSEPQHLQQQYHQPQCHTFPQCHGYDSCAPGLSLLSDSEDSSFASSCGTEEFFDLEDLTSAFQLMDNWKKPNKTVRFGNAKVREYKLTVGDHPICKDGLALSLDWKHSSERVYSIDDYELHRRRRKTLSYRGRRTMRLDYWQRREILKRVGCFSNHELSKIQRQRQEQDVKEFLASAHPDELDPSSDIEDNVHEEEEHLQGFELLEMEYPEDDLLAGLSYYDPKEWRMKVEVVED
ncbi:hypothetical protein IV203_011476 [Nitzschia inconspicua]|uniref:Uncharacterized protein n=1 Tax=Nitzschia inconspicua TaxID=303405 RepID=A0A9K3KT85_9STRA|nr:hypothetical protein IV203_011476 [Nitzschia inconspicua]